MQFRGLICSNYPILRVAGCPELHDRRGSWKVRRECDDLPVLPAAVPGRRRRAAGRRRTQSLHDRRALRQPVPRRAAGSAARVGQRHPLKGEHTLLGLVEAPAAGKPWSTVAGLAYDVEGAMDGAIAESPPRALIQDLDTLPFPHVPTIRNSSSASGHCRCWPAVAVPDVARSARSTPSTGPHPARPSGSAPLRGWSRRCGCCTTSTACASSSSKTMTSRSGAGPAPSGSTSWRIGCARPTWPSGSCGRSAARGVRRAGTLRSAGFLRQIGGDGTAAALFRRMLPYGGTPIREQTGQRGPVEGQRHAPGLRLPRSAAECLPPAARCRCEALDPQRRHLPSTELGLGRVLHSPPPRAGSHGRAGVRQALRGLPARTCTPDCCDCATASCGTTSMRWSTRSRSATCTDR